MYYLWESLGRGGERERRKGWGGLEGRVHRKMHILRALPRLSDWDAAPLECLRVLSVSLP